MLLKTTYNRFLIAVLFISMFGCKKNEVETFPLIGKWKMDKLLMTTIIYTSGGKRYEESYTRVITPSTDIMEFRSNGEVVQGSNILNYTKEVYNSINRVIIESKSNNTKSVYSWKIDDENILAMALENYWEALGNPTDANKIVLAKSLASSSPSSFPNISTATSVSNIIPTYYYKRQ